MLITDEKLEPWDQCELKSKTRWLKLLNKQSGIGRREEKKNGGHIFLTSLWPPNLMSWDKHENQTKNSIFLSIKLNLVDIVYMFILQTRVFSKWG